MYGMEDKKLKKEIIEDLIQFLNDKMANHLSGKEDEEEAMEGDMHEMPDGEMMHDSEMKEPTVVEIEMEKKPLSEAMKEKDFPLEIEDDENLSSLAEKKLKKEKKEY